MPRDPGEKIDALSALTGISGTPEGSGTVSIYQDDETMLRVYEDGTWYACWASDQDEASPKLTEEELLSSACDRLDKLGYTQAALAEWAWQDEVYKVVAAVSRQEEEHWLTGAVK